MLCRVSLVECNKLVMDCCPCEKGPVDVGKYMYIYSTRAVIELGLASLFHIAGNVIRRVGGPSVTDTNATPRLRGVWRTERLTSS